jgi:F-type H+-transporting ATPase subunit b
MPEEAFYQDPAFWFFVAFVIFFVLVTKPVSRMAAKALDDRGEKIRSELDEAEKLRAEAQELLATYQRKQRDAAKEAEAIVERAREEAQRLAARSAEELSQTLARREKMAVDRIAQAEHKAIQEVRVLAVDLALDATRRLIEQGVAADGSKGDAMIDAAIKDLPARLH